MLKKESGAEHLGLVVSSGRRRASVSLVNEVGQSFWEGCLGRCAVMEFLSSARIFAQRTLRNKARSYSFWYSLRISSLPVAAKSQLRSYAACCIGPLPSRRADSPGMVRPNLQGRFVVSIGGFRMFTCGRTKRSVSHVGILRCGGFRDRSVRVIQQI